MKVPVQAAAVAVSVQVPAAAQHAPLHGDAAQDDPGPPKVLVPVHPAAVVVVQTSAALQQRPSSAVQGLGVQTMLPARNVFVPVQVAAVAIEHVPEVEQQAPHAPLSATASVNVPVPALKPETRMR